MGEPAAKLGEAMAEDVAPRVITFEVAVIPPASAPVPPVAPALSPARITRKRSKGKGKSSTLAEQRSPSLPCPLPSVT